MRARRIGPGKRFSGRHLKPHMTTIKDVAAYLSPPLTTVAQPMALMGRLAFEMRGAMNARPWTLSQLSEAPRHRHEGRRASTERYARSEP